MTLLDIITATTASSHPQISTSTDFPITLKPDISLLTLLSTAPDPNSPLLPLKPLAISSNDAQIIQSNQQFVEKLKSNKFRCPDKFVHLLTSLLEETAKRYNISINLNQSAERYCSKLVEKYGFMIGREACSLVIESCVDLEVWDVLEQFIVSGFVPHCCYSSLVTGLVNKKNPELVVSCIKRFSDLNSFDLLAILRFFLSTSLSLEDCSSVRKEWEIQALSVIEMCKDDSLKSSEIRLAKEAGVLLMVAYDEFTSRELCLHYLLASGNIDEVVLTSAISKLGGAEMIALVRYLGKWLRKYERFPQAGPCPGLKACDWVPKLENIVQCLGLIIDEHFSSLVLHPEFHEELKDIGGVVSSMALEARLCGSLASMVENLREANKS